MAEESTTDAGAKGRLGRGRNMAPSSASEGGECVKFISGGRNILMLPFGVPREASVNDTQVRCLLL